MKKYTASNELAEILIQNGFTETTQKHYPDHYRDMQTEGYSSHKYKRSFRLNRAFSIFFDYITITPSINGGCHGYDLRTEITQDELDHIISVAKMSDYQKRKYFTQVIGFFPLQEAVLS